MDEVEALRIPSSIAFSIELLQTSQLSDRKPAFLFPICIPKRRIAFVDINGLPITGKYACQRSNLCGDNVSSFVQNFSQFGIVRG